MGSFRFWHYHTKEIHFSQVSVEVRTKKVLLNLSENPIFPNQDNLQLLSFEVGGGNDCPETPVYFKVSLE